VGIDVGVHPQDPAKPGETRILVVLPADPPAEQGRALLSDWRRQGHRVIVVAAREPYPLAAYGDAPCQVATYGDGVAAIAALVEVLLGRARPQGRLPVSVVRKPLSGYNAVD
jgi:hypothetical protein